MSHFSRIKLPLHVWDLGYTEGGAAVCVCVWYETYNPCVYYSLDEGPTEGVEIRGFLSVGIGTPTVSSKTNTPTPVLKL